jgi:hypothetical protein
VIRPAITRYIGSIEITDRVVDWSVDVLDVFMGVADGVTVTGTLGSGVGVLGFTVDGGVGDDVFCGVFCVKS